MININPKLVSIILPTRNRGYCVGQTIDSVLAQTYSNWELIIVDGASTDDTPSIAKNYCQQDSRIHYHRSFPRQGLPRDRNIGVSLSQGELVYFIEDDVTVEPDCLETLVDTLVSLSAEGLKVGAIAPRTIDKFGEESKLILLMRYASELNRRGKTSPSYVNNLTGIILGNFGMESNQLLETPTCPSWSLINKCAFVDVRGFDEEAYERYNFFYEEADFYFRLREKGYKLYFQAKAVVCHTYGVSGGTRTSAVRYYYNFLRSHICFLRRHFGWRSIYMALFTPPYLLYNTILGTIELARRR